MNGTQPLPVPSKSRMSNLRSKILCICEVIKLHVYSCLIWGSPRGVFQQAPNTAGTLQNVSYERNEFLVDAEKDMTHIGTPKARRLSLSKKRRKGTGRHGFAADRLKTDSSKGTWDLFKRERESGMFMYIFKIQYMLHIFCVILQNSVMISFFWKLVCIYLICFYLFTERCKGAKLLKKSDHFRCI